MDDYLRHEALDRVHLLIDMIGNYLLEHSHITQDNSLFAQVSNAQAILCDVYQQIGQRHLARPGPQQPDTP